MPLAGEVMRGRRLFTGKGMLTYSPSMVAASVKVLEESATPPPTCSARLRSLPRCAPSSKPWRGVPGDPRSHLAAAAIAAYVELDEWQIGGIRAGIAELDSGGALSETEAEVLYRRLLQPP